MRIADFLERELSETPKFRAISEKAYEENADTRRNLERWVENVTNASVDIAKIILASEKKPLPQTYADMLAALRSFEEIGENHARLLGEYAKLINVLAHEYLDIRYSKIKKFLEHIEVYEELVAFSKKVINQQK